MLAGAEIVATAAKMAASAAVVVVAARAVERAGPLVAAMIATLPLSAGPAYLFLALEHGPDFLRASAVASLPAIAATGILIVVYAALARRGGLALSLGAGLLAWGAAATALRQLAPGLAPAAGLAALALLACMAAGRAIRPARPVPRRPGRPRDVAIRAGIVMGLVGLVLLAGRVAGPGLAGLLALAPVVMVSLALILHPRLGGEASAGVLVLGLPGLLGFVAALTILALTVERLGAAFGLTLALLVTLAWNGGILLLNRLWPSRPSETVP
ncbi:conserved hypothetical protein [Methylobacterium sp. 4-46]|uniref:hypothetical protein n=1 Tax=unclassified Methylobacterium TaxID=2615210 RepID=UPI000152D162|nr:MULTISPECIES: hypothetical protein [Methylobacterium]ACA19367.1 conserved hypothetical protein [Methylobacterium sp. 4-46]WFT78566.1 hypothetical protein QA634_25335 [Methylobacterium nodulans]